MDQCPIILYTRVKWVCPPFKVENMWLTELVVEMDPLSILGGILGAEISLLQFHPYVTCPFKIIMNLLVFFVAHRSRPSSNSSTPSNWNFHFPRNLPTKRKEKLLPFYLLFQILGSKIQLSWLGDPSGSFTCKSFFEK